MALSQQQADDIAASLGTVTPFVAPLNPVIPLIISIIQAGIKSEPKLEGALKALFSGKDPLTLADFDAAIAHVQQSSYRSLVPSSSLSESEDPSTPAPVAPPTP